MQIGANLLGNVILLSFEDHVEKLLLRFGSYGRACGESCHHNSTNVGAYNILGHESFPNRSISYV